MPTEPLPRFVLILAALALVVWIRLLPLSLGGVEATASQIAMRQVGPQPSAFKTAQVAAADHLKEDLRYEGKDGRHYPYLGDYDSYVWLTNARNYLRTGTTCDEVVDTECRDTLTHAPVGARKRYARSLHIVAIVALHRLITVVLPDFPLPATSFLVPVLVGALGVLPAFAIGQRLAGGLGGLAAAVLISLNPLFLRRSIGSDNDVWNIVLPLFMVWSALAALAAPGARRQAAWAGVAALFAVLHAATWSGWIFGYGVLLAGLLANLIICACGVALGKQPVAAARRAVLVLIVFYATTGLGTTLVGSERSYWELPATMLAPLLPQAPAAAPKLGEASNWPSTFETVAELASSNLASIAKTMGGRVTFFVGWLGLLVLLLPTVRWKWWHYAILIGGNYLYRYLLTTAGLGRLTLLELLALPLVVAVFLHLFVDRDVEGVSGGELVVAIWFLAALFLSYTGVRFVMLLVPPFGLVCAVAVGRLHRWLDQRTARLGARFAGLARPLLFVAFAALLIEPVRLARASAQGYLPRINDAWWQTLTHLRDQTPADAIVNSWWDFGYWIKYVAERRVSADGASLATHIPHWLGRALVAVSEEESAGLLRMLNCRSDATPEPEGRQGAYGKLIARGFDPTDAHELIVTLAPLGRDAARAHLTAHHLSPEAATDVLSSTHCDPPPSYLVLTTALLPIEGWRSLGNWDFRRAYAADHARTLAESVAVADFAGRFGLTDDAARVLYREARELRSPTDRERFISPSPGYFHRGWIPCRRALDGTLSCETSLAIDRQGTMLRAVVFRPQTPGDDPLRVQRRGGVGGMEVGAPGLLIVAGAEAMDEVLFSVPTHPDLAVLLDEPNARLLLGPPYLLRSTFTELMFLDGRYNRLFTKFDDRSAYGGERVTTWRIDWNELGD